MTSQVPPFVLHEATYKHMMQLKPNLAILPWGATEAHGYHLPYGTDVIEASALGRLAAHGANECGARCVLLPAVPFGVNHSQLYQVATITMRARTQHVVLFDVCDSLVRQGIDRLVVLNFHGGNDFKAIIRDLMLELPIFIAQVHGWKLSDCDDLLDDSSGEHADELETSLMLHLKPQWVDMTAASDGHSAPSQLPAFSSAEATWSPRDWQCAAPDTGIGDPKAATNQKGKVILERLVTALVPVLVELSQAHPGQFPFVIRSK